MLIMKYSYSSRHERSMNNNETASLATTVMAAGAKATVCLLVSLVGASAPSCAAPIYCMVPWASTNLHHQTAFWLVQPFLQGSRAADSCDQWSDAQHRWQTTLHQDICRNRPHLDSAAKWHVHSLNSWKWYRFIRCPLLITVTLVCYRKIRNFLNHEYVC